MSTTSLSTDLLERLARHRSVGAAPRTELEWLAANGTLVRYAPGDFIIRKQHPVRGFMVMLEGRMGVWVDAGEKREKVMEWVGGDLSGQLPYSRMTHSPGDALVDEETLMLEIPRDRLPEMIRECPVVTTAAVHAMLDRARVFRAADFQVEKWASLGQLAAQLAHEMNNPSAAAIRSAQQLGELVAASDQAAMSLGAANLSAQQRAMIERVRDNRVATPERRQWTPIERADREEEITGWLQAHGVTPDLAAALVESRLTDDDRNLLAATLDRPSLDAALQWIAASCTVRAIATEIAHTTERIHAVVAAVKRYTHMDRAVDAELTDISEGLNDTVILLGAAARAKAVSITSDVPSSLPLVRVFPPEVSQVWMNLLKNAIEAAPPEGGVTVQVIVEGGHLVVHFIDNGPGIPAEIRHRIYDPRFTTKTGNHSGMGLDTALNFVRHNRADIDFVTEPGRTDFFVRLPVVKHHRNELSG